MSSGFLVAATADLAVAREVADAFGLDVLEATMVAGHETAAATLAAAPNVGLLLSNAAAHDGAFVSLLQIVAQRIASAHLIVIDPDARAAFAFLPEAWPALSLDEARRRSAEAARRREEAAGGAPAAPADPQPEARADDGAADSEQTQQQEQQQQQQEQHEEPAVEEPASEPEQPIAAEPPPIEQEREDAQLSDELETQADSFGAEPEEHAPREELEAEPSPEAEEPTVDDDSGEYSREISLDDAEDSAGAAPPADEPPAPIMPAPAPYIPPPAAEPPQAPPQSAAPPRAAEPPPPPIRSMDDTLRDGSPPAGAATGTLSRARQNSAPSAPADATAFAPKKLRRGTPELVRIAIHQPKDLKAVIKAAKKADPRTDAAPQSMGIGDVAIGAKIGVALDVKGAAADGALQRQTWTGEPLTFSFSVEADTGVKQAVFLVRVLIDDAQIGVLAFTRPISGPSKKPASDGERARLKRHKRVFLSYSSKDRETVAAIATAYQMAGVAHFFDRTSLKSGEQWHPRLRREIDRSDLFHLCWSKSAADSEWVSKEAEHALTRQRRSNGKNPAITVQMLDGPPWAPHPPTLDSINFDDFVRAAIVGYARGEG